MEQGTIPMPETLAGCSVEKPRRSSFRLPIPTLPHKARRAGGSSSGRHESSVEGPLRARTAAATAARAASVAGGFLGFIVAEMAAGQRDEDVFEADLPGRQPDEVPSLGLELIEE